ncbi:MAG: hypothetical protein VX910_00280, partial [Candidatus Latescibacterota bacterium]|nr:hypothetical protein [Candidatus Latescibacterota bacterium]
GGTHLSTPDLSLTTPRAVLSGRILSSGSRAGDSWFDIDAEPSALQHTQGQTLFSINDGNQHGYPIRGTESVSNGCRLFTKRDHVGFEARNAKRWEIPVTSVWSDTAEGTQ